MPKLNGTVRWIGTLVAVAFGVWGVAATVASKVVSLEPRVASCETRLNAVERDSVRMDTRLAYMEEMLREIKADTKELRAR